jgi:hypothetical protein
MHRVRLRPPFLIKRNAIRVLDHIAVIVDVVDRTVPKQIYASSLGAVEGYTLGLHVMLNLGSSREMLRLT